MADDHSTGRVRPANLPTERRLTVGTQYYASSSRHRRERRVPWLQMRGDWLAAAGFDIRTPVRVRVMHGCLVVTVEEA